MSVHRDEHLDLCAARALGSIDEADRLELEQHLAEGCAECEQALADFGVGAAQLGASVAAATPSPRVRAAVLEQVRAAAAASPSATRAEREPSEPSAFESRPSPATARGATEVLPRRRAEWPAWAFATAAVFLAVSTIATWRTAERLRFELRGANERLVQTELQLAQEREWAAVITRPGARVVDLAPLTGGAALPRVRATYDPDSRRAVIVFNHLVTPPDSDFELWAILPDGPRSLGVVRPDADGRAEVRVADAGDPASLAAFALSLERAGGSGDPRKPGGPVVLAGSVKS